MSNGNDKLLKPLRDIFLNIIAEPEERSKYITQIEKYAEKGAFFEHHVFAQTFEAIANNPDLPMCLVKDFFKMMKQMLNGGSNSKDSIVSLLYNFICQNKNRRDDLFSCLVFICTFETDPLLSTKTEFLFAITESLLKVAKPEDIPSRKALYMNFRKHIKSYSQHDELSLKLFNSINRTTKSMISEKKLEEAENFLEDTLVSSAVSGTLNIPNDEAYEEILNILTFLIRYGQRKNSTYKLCFHFTSKISGQLTNKIHIKCNDILVKMFTMCCKSEISNEGIKDLFSTHYEKVESKNVLHEKTAMLVGKLFEYNIQRFETTPEFLYTFHRFTISIFNVYKHIKNQEGIVNCCNDVKRHLTNTLNGNVISLAARVIKAGRVNEFFGKSLIYHLTYGVSLVNDMKCQNKDKETLNTYERLYHVLYEMFVTSPSISLNRKLVSQCAECFMKLWKNLPEKLRSTGTEPDTMLQRAYNNPTDEKDAEICANGITSILIKHKDLSSYLACSKDDKKVFMRTMITLRQASKLLKFSTATDYLRTKQTSTTNAYLPILALIEMTAVSRYDVKVSTEVNSELFLMICKLTMCPLTLAQACQSLSDEVIKKISRSDFKKVIKLLEVEEKQKFNLDVSLSLALINYSVFFVTVEKIENEMKAVVELSDKRVKNLNLKEEIEILNFLNESLRYFTDVVVHLSKHREDIDKIISSKKLIGIVNNMAYQFYIRGIKYKDLEAFTVLWHFSLIVGQEVAPVLSVATFFLESFEMLTDSSGNYIKISKKIKPLTIEEVLAESNALVDKQIITTFEEQSSIMKYTVCSYLLSLWVYYLRQGRHADAEKRWNQFKTTWKSSKMSDEFAHNEVIKAKMYFCIVEINMKCCQRVAYKFLSQGVAILVAAKKINREFIYIYYQIYNQIAIKTINYSLNRLSDMTHFNVLMASFIASVTKKGHCIKLIDLLSLSIMRNLSMEKIEHAKAQLGELTMVIGLKEEILVESPLKVDVSSAVLHRELFKEQVRKVEISPLKSEFSMIYQEHSSQLFEQLKSFIHKESCKCEICKIPQLKFCMFQIGCHYSRLMWMMDKSEISRDFNEFALHPWRSICDKLRRTKDCEFLAVNKIDFAVFSTRWLFQTADSLISLRMFEEVEEIYQEVELVCTSNMLDYNCFKEILHVRKENLNFLIEQSSAEDRDESESDLSFNEFMKRREKTDKEFSTPELMMNRVVKKKLPSSVDSDVIYIDSEEDLRSAPSKLSSKKPQSTRKQTSKTPKLSSEPKPTSKSKLQVEPTPKKSTRKIKLTTNDETPVTTSTRKTSRRMV